MSDQTIAQRKTLRSNGKLLSDSPHFEPISDRSGISAMDDIASENRSQTNESSIDKPFGAIRGVLWALSLEAVFAAVIFALVICALWAQRL